MSIEQNPSEKIDKNFLRAKDQIIHCPSGHELLATPLNPFVYSISTFPWNYEGDIVVGETLIIKPEVFEPNKKYKIICPHCQKTKTFIFKTSINKKTSTS